MLGQFDIDSHSYWVPMNTWVGSDKRRLTSFQKTLILGWDLNGSRTITPWPITPWKLPPKDYYPPPPVKITPEKQPSRTTTPRTITPRKNSPPPPRNNCPRGLSSWYGFELSTSWLESEVNEPTPPPPKKKKKKKKKTPNKQTKTKNKTKQKQNSKFIDTIVL